MVTLQNDVLQLSIREKGAELCSIRSKIWNLEYLWQADPAVWGKHSPVLFPIVGTLKNNQFRVDSKVYTLTRHGFARDREFEFRQISGTEVLYTLQADKETRTVYPYQFVFRIGYSLKGNRLEVEYQVENPDRKEMFFSVGGHPAFRVPLEKGTQYEDYSLEFEKEEAAPRWPIDGEGLIKTRPEPFLMGRKIALRKQLFDQDALVFKHLNSSSVRLQSDKTERGWAFRYPGFPFLGIWAAKGGDFVCVEPWCGIADSADSDQHFPSKEGIIRLAPSELFSRTWSVEFY